MTAADRAARLEEIRQRWQRPPWDQVELDDHGDPVVDRTFIDGPGIHRAIITYRTKQAPAVIDTDDPELVAYQDIAYLLGEIERLEAAARAAMEERG